MYILLVYSGGGGGGRQTSPISLRSPPGSRMQSQNSSCHSHVNCQGSVYNERWRSFMSLTSVGSNSSAANLVLALNNSNLNKYELRMIKDACNSLMSSRRSKRISRKRSNCLSIFKCCTRMSSGESGVERSDSSSSSDNCRLTRLTSYTENFPVTETRPVLANCNKNTTHTSVNDIYEDCLENESDVTLEEHFTESYFPRPSQRFSKPAAQSTNFIEKSKKNQSQESSDKCKKNKIYEEKTISTTDKQTEPACESENKDYDIGNTGIINNIGNTTHSHLMQCKDNVKEVENLKHSILKDSNCTKNNHTNVQCEVVIDKVSDNKVQTKSTKTKRVTFLGIDLNDVDSPLKKKYPQEPSPKKLSHVKSSWNTDLRDVNDNVRSTLKMKSSEETRSKKVGLAKTFWDTDLSDEDDSVESPLIMKSQQEQLTSLNETINSNDKRGNSIENIKTSIRLNRPQMTYKEDEPNVENSKKDSTRHRLMIEIL